MSSIRIGYVTSETASGISSLIEKYKSGEKIPTLWYENKDGEKFYPDFSTGLPPDVPDEYCYQVSRFPCTLNENILKIVQQDEVDECDHPEDYRSKDLGIVPTCEGETCEKCGGYRSRVKGGDWTDWEATGSRSVMSGSMSWSEDLVLELANAGMSLSNAIIVAATSCERCMNVLAFEMGLDWGYPEFSDDWHKCGTECEFCKSDSSREAGIVDVVKRIKRVVRDPEKMKEMGRRVIEFFETGDKGKDLTPKEQRLLYRNVDFGEELPLTKNRDVDIGWTDHSEYRSELRDVDPEEVNEEIVERMRENLNPPERKKKKFKEPGVGTFVVDYDTGRPSDADVITVWGKELLSVAQKISAVGNGWSDAYEMSINAVAVFSEWHFPRKIAVEALKSFGYSSGRAKAIIRDAVSQYIEWHHIKNRNGAHRKVDFIMVGDLIIYKLADEEGDELAQSIVEKWGDDPVFWSDEFPDKKLEERYKEVLSWR